MTFSCDNSVLNVRKRDIEEDDSSMKEVMVYQTERDLNTVEANDTNVIEVTTSHSISLQFHAPRRSCRINIGSVAIAIGRYITPHMDWSEVCNRGNFAI